MKSRPMFDARRVCTKKKSSSEHGIEELSETKGVQERREEDPSNLEARREDGFVGHLLSRSQKWGPPSNPKCCTAGQPNYCSFCHLGAPAS